MARHSFPSETRVSGCEGNTSLNGRAACVRPFFEWHPFWFARHLMPLTMCRDGWFGLPLSNRNAREAPTLASGLLRVWALVSAHAVQFEDGVNRIACRRRNAELAAERTYLPGEPIKLQPIAALKIMRH
jgi:hypothetical protein